MVPPGQQVCDDLSRRGMIFELLPGVQLPGSKTLYRLPLAGDPMSGRVLLVMEYVASANIDVPFAANCCTVLCCLLLCPLFPPSTNSYWDSISCLAGELLVCAVSYNEKVPSVVDTPLQSVVSSGYLVVCFAFRHGSIAGPSYVGACIECSYIVWFSVATGNITRWHLLRLLAYCHICHTPYIMIRSSLIASTFRRG